MKKRVAETLKEMGCAADVETFRRTLAEVKAEKFAEWSIDELCFTRDEAADFCQLVRKRLGSPKLTRVFILRSLVGLRKNKPKPKAVETKGKPA
jgi:hypothetical protein